jgi:hypothetical protein
VGSRIYGYRTTDKSDTSDTFIVIRPLDVPTPVKGVSNNYLAETHFFQIDVESRNLGTANEVQNEIRRIMHSFNLWQQPNGLDEFFNETQRFVDGRRYTGVPDGLYYTQKLI